MVIRPLYCAEVCCSLPSLPSLVRVAGSRALFVAVLKSSRAGKIDVHRRRSLPSDAYYSPRRPGRQCRGRGPASFVNETARSRLSDRSTNGRSDERPVKVLCEWEGRQMHRMYSTHRDCIVAVQYTYYYLTSPAVINDVLTLHDL